MFRTHPDDSPPKASSKSKRSRDSSPGTQPLARHNKSEAVQADDRVSQHVLAKHFDPDESRSVKRIQLRLPSKARRDRSSSTAQRTSRREREKNSVHDFYHETDPAKRLLLQQKYFEEHFPTPLHTERHGTCGVYPHDLRVDTSRYLARHYPGLEEDGVYATRAFKTGDCITDYPGILWTESDFRAQPDDIVPKTHARKLSTLQMVIDGNVATLPGYGVGSKINSVNRRNDPERNAAFLRDLQGMRQIVVATRDIEPDEEILMYYGKDYWKRYPHLQQ